VRATGLGRARRPQLVSTPVARTGTYDASAATTTTDAVPGANQTFEPIRTPAVWRREHASETVRAMERNGTETYDIPAFLRRQAD
jgi:cell division protein FtsZ